MLMGSEGLNVFPMHMFFINLAWQTRRRQDLQSNFSQYGAATHFLHRVEALTPSDVVSVAVEGDVTEVEKACYFSHQRAIEAACDYPGHVYILEDDSRLGPNTLGLIAKSIEYLEDSDPAWDILFTQMMPTSPAHILELADVRQQCMNAKTLIVTDTKRMTLAGACGYVVNAKSKFSLLSMFRENANVNTPVDKFYWLLGRQGAIRTKLMFPMASSVAAQSAQSQIQSHHKSVASHVWSIVMRLNAYDRDLQELERECEGLPHADSVVAPELEVRLRALSGILDPQEARILGMLMSTICSPGFVPLFSVDIEPDLGADG